MRLEMIRIKNENSDLKRHVGRCSHEAQCCEASVGSGLSVDQKNSVSTAAVINAANTMLNTLEERSESAKKDTPAKYSMRRRTLISSSSTKAGEAKDNSAELAAKKQYGKMPSQNPMILKPQSRVRSSLFHVQNDDSSGYSYKSGRSSTGSQNQKLKPIPLVPLRIKQGQTTTSQPESQREAWYESQNNMISVENQLQSSHDFCHEDVDLDVKCDYINIQAK